MAYVYCIHAKLIISWKTVRKKSELLPCKWVTFYAINVIFNEQQTFSYAQPIKLGSCSNDDDSVKNTFVFFCVAFKSFNLFNLFMSNKLVTAGICWKVIHKEQNLKFWFCPTPSLVTFHKTTLLQIYAWKR